VDAYAAGSVQCRAATGTCDVAETCTGTTATCPDDGFGASSVECRAAAGACDVAESCTGTDATCPADALVAAGTACHAATDVCDLSETCDGVAAVCPDDLRSPDADVDGVCDAIDVCPIVPDPEQGDGDSDGVGDACDPCSNVVPIFTDTARLRFSRLLTPPGDDRLRLTGVLQLPEALRPRLDPRVRGLRVLVTTVAGVTVLDAILPPDVYDRTTGSGWLVATNRRGWAYLNRGRHVPLVAGVQRVTLHLARHPGTIRFSVRGKLGTYPVGVADLPLRATVVLDAPIARTGACAETPVVDGACAVRAGGRSVRCRW
jgi:hypothetical protein